MSTEDKYYDLSDAIVDNTDIMLPAITLFKTSEI